jgi:uncharacterized membrane protein YbhN (UPF0104 family)
MKRLLRPFISLVLLAAVVWYAGGVAAIVRPIFGGEVLWVAAALVVVTVDRLLMTFKWVWLLRSQGAAPLGLLAGLRIYASAMLSGLFLLSTVGPDAVRIVLTARRGLDTGIVLASVVVERMVGFITSLLLGLVGLAILDAHGIVDPGWKTINRAGAVVLAIALLLFTLSFNNRLSGSILAYLPSGARRTRVTSKLLHLHRTYVGFAARPGPLTTFAALTVVEQLVTIVYTWCTARAVGVDVTLIFIAGVLPLTLLVSRLPISFDGLGVFEAVFIVLMGLGGVSPAQATSVAVIGRVIQTLALLPWSIAHIWTPASIREPRPSAAAPPPPARVAASPVEPRS